VAGVGDLDISVVELPEGATLVRVAGELDLGTVSKLEDALVGTTGAVRLVVDLTDCTFLDSSAVRVLLHEAAGRDDGTYAVVAPDPGVRKALEIAGVETMLPIYSTVAEAL